MSYNNNVKQNVRIIQWNARSIKANRETLEYIIKKYDIDIVLLCETWLRPQDFFSGSGFSIYRHDRPDGYGGVAIMVKNSFSHKKINLNTSHINFEVIAIEVTMPNHSHINFISAYAPPQTIITHANWQFLIKQIGKNYIIGGDFNSHSPAWGCSYEDNGGRNLIDNIDSSSLIILNDGSQTMIPHPIRRRSPIDLTLCTPSIAPSVSWSVFDESAGSDHLIIKINLNLQYNTSSITRIDRNKINTKKINWNKYHELLLNADPINNYSIESYNQFVSNVKVAAHLASPTPRSINKKEVRASPIWWDSNCTEAIRLRKSKFVKYSKHINFENFMEYKKADAEVKKLLKYKKRSKWKIFCSSINKNTPNNEVWKQLKLFKNLGVPTCPNTDSILEPFADLISPPYVESNISYYPQESTPHFLTVPFTFKELSNVLNCKKDTAPGPDGISYSLLRELPTSSKCQLLEFINWFSSNNVFPDSWTTHNIVLVPKPNKNHSLPESFRPITLACCVEKVFESMVKQRLDWWLESRNFFSSSQHGFRRGKSTIDNLSILVNDIQYSFMLREITTAIFLDIKGAFDNVNLEILAMRLKSYNFPNNLINNLIYLYRSRQIIVKNNNIQLETRRLSKGLPQGLVLSPYLFMIYLKEIESTLTSDVKMLQFADDLVIYTSSHSIGENINRLSSSLTNMCKWLSDCGLGIEAAKTKAMIFTRKYKVQIPTSVSLNNIIIEVVMSHKFLGVYLDSKLNWKDQTNYIIKKCEKKINILKAVANTSWGADPNTCLVLYRSFIRPHLDYGCALFDNASNYIANKLNILQYRCLRQALGALKSSPTNALLSEAKEMPLNIRRRFLIDNYVLKKISMSDFPVLESIYNIEKIFIRENLRKEPPYIVKSFRYLQNLNLIKYPKYSIFCHEYDIQLHTINLAKLPYSRLSSHLNSLHLDFIGRHFPDYISIYTDGSKNQGGVGFAIWCPALKYEGIFKLSPECSVFTAESLAILEGIKFFKSSGSTGNLLICTDSLSAIQAIEGFPKNKNISYVILKIIEQIVFLKSCGIIISLLWIPGHSNIMHNEKVDRLAQLATLQGETVTNLRLPINDVKSLIKRRAYLEWQEYWDSSKNFKGSHLHNIMPKIPLKPWFTEVSLFRKIVTQVTRLRLGHVICPQYLFRIKLRENPYCDCDFLSIGDANHIYLSCKKNKCTIDRFLREISSFIPLPTYLSIILQNMFDNVEVFKIVIRHIVTIGSTK